MKNHSSNPRYIILTLTIATLLAFFALQAGAAYTTITTPITGTVSTTFSGPDIQILVSSDGNTLSSDAGGDGIYAGSGGAVSIDKMSGGPDSLVINSGSSGVNVDGGTVSSDADLVINSGRNGVNNNGGTVNLAGVSIDAASAANIAGINNTGSGSTTISGDQALIRASTSVDDTDAAAIANSGGSVSIKTSGDVLLAAKSNASSRNASSLISNTGSSTVSVDAGGQVTFDVTAQSAKGLDNTAAPDFGTGVTVTAAKGVSYAVTATNGEAAGIGASGSVIDFGKVNSVVVNATGGPAYGLFAQMEGSSLSGDVQSLTVNSNSNAYGVYANRSGDVQLALSGDMTVNSANSGAYGVYARNGGNVQLAMNGDMAVSSANGQAYGVYAGSNSGSGGNVQLAMNGDMAVSSDNSMAYGVYAGSMIGSGGNVQLAMSGDMAVSSANGQAYGVYAGSMIGSGGNVQLAMSGDMAVSSDNSMAYGVYADKSGVVSGDAQNLTVNSANGKAYGIDISSNKVSTINIADDLTVKGAAGGAGIEASGAAHQITVGGLTDVSIASNGDNAIYAADGANVNLNGGVSLDVTGITGDVSGIKANGGNVTVSGSKAIVKASTTGENLTAYAINNTGSGDISINTGDAGVELTASAENGEANAVSNSGTGKVTIATTGQVSFDVTGLTAKGLYYDGTASGVSVDAKGGSSYAVTATNGSAFGVAVSGSGNTLSYGKVNNVVVNATGDYAGVLAAYGFAALSGGTLSGDGTNSIKNVSVTADKDVAGVYADNGSSVTGASIDNLTVNSGRIAFGINVSRNSSADLTVDNLTVNSASNGFGIDVSDNSSADLTVGNMHVNGSNNTYGVYAAISGNVQLALSGDLAVKSANGFAYGAYADNSSVKFTGVRNLTVSADNGVGFGLYAINGSVSGDAQSLTVNANSDAIGVEAISSNLQLALSGDMAVNSANRNAYGAYADSGDVQFTGVRNLTVSADNGVGYGLYALGGSVSGNAQSLTVNSKYNAYGVSAGTRSDVQLALSGDLAVNSASGDAYGAYADSGSVKFTGVRNLTVSADNGKGYGLYALGDADNQLLGSVSGDVQSLTVNSYKNAYGVYAETSGDVQLALSGDLAVNSANNNAYGIRAVNNGSVKFTGVRNLTVSADNGVGFGLYAINGSVSGDAQSLTVTSANGNAYGINISSNKVSNINIAKDLTVKGADGGAGIEASGAAHQITVGGLTDVVVAANGYNAVYAADGANVNLNGGASLDVTGTDEVSGIAADGGNVSVSGNKAIVKASTTGDNAKAYAINNTGSGAVTIDTGDAGVELTAKATSGDAAAIGNSGTGSVTVKTRGQASFDVTGLSAKGLSSNSGAGITVSAAGGSNYAVTATSGDAYGLEADNSNLAYGKVNNLTVNATNGNANGLAAMNSGALGSDTAMNGAISATAKGSNYVIANAVYASDISSVKLNGVTGISAVGANAADAENESDAYAVNAVSSSDVEIAMNGDMKASGSGTTAYADGLFANYSKVSASGVKNLIVSATGTAGDESAWGVDATGGSDVALAMGGDMKVSSTGNAYGVDAYSDSTVSLSGARAISVTADSGDAYGINAYDRSAVSADAGSLTAVSNKGAAYGINLYTDHVSSIDVTGDLTVRSAAGGTGITAAGAQHQITVGGLTDISIAARGYNAVYAADGANVNLNDGASLDVTGTDEVSGIAADGGNVTVSGDKAVIKASTTGDGATAYALSNTGSGDIAINTGDEGVELTASSVSGDAQAIGNSGTGKVTVATTGQVSFDVTGQNAVGLSSASGSNITVSAAQGSNYAVTATSGDAYGIAASGDTTLAYGKVNNVIVTATSGDAYGLAALSGATFSGDANSAISNIAVTENTAGKTAYGILASGDSTVNAGAIDAISVNSAGAGYGVLVNDRSKLTAKIGSITVNASGDAYGLYAPSTTSTLDVSISGPVKVTTEKGKAIGVYSASGGVTVSDDQAVITAISKSSDASAITPDSGDITVEETNGVDLTAKTDEGTATGVNVSTGKTVDVTTGGAVSADVSGAKAYGFKAEKGNTAADSLINIDAGKDLAVKAAATNGEAAGFYASGDVAKITYKADGALSVNISSASGDAYGYRTVNGGVISGDSVGGTVAVKSAGGSASGVEAMFGSNVTVSGVKTMTVSSDAGVAYGINADDSTANVGTQSMNVYSASSNAGGVFDNSGDVTLAMNGDLAVNSAGSNVHSIAYGVHALDGGSVKFTGVRNLTVSADNGVGNGLYASNGSVSGDAQNLTVNSKSSAFGVGAVYSGDVNLALSGDLAVNSVNGGAYGVDAEDSGSVKFTGVRNLTVSSDNGSGYGIYAQDGSVSGDAQSLTVTSANGNAYGINISSNKVSNINIAKDLTVKGADGGAGIEASGAAHRITVGGLTDVDIAANGTNAVAAADGSSFALNGGVSIDVTGTGEVSGIRADGGNVTVGGDKAIVKASTTGDGATAYALSNTGSGDISINTGDAGVELTASSASGDAQAIGNSGTGKVTVKTSGQASFDVTGLTAKGIFNTTSQGTGVTVSATGGSNYKITATNGDAYGIAADGVALDYGKVNNVAVTATNGNAYGLLADNSGTLSGDTASPIKSLTVTASTAGYSAYGILASGDKSQANIGTVDKLTVTSSGDAYGVYANNNGSVNGNISGDIDVTAAGDAYGVYANNNGSVNGNISGDIDVTASGKAYGVYANNKGVVTGTVSGKINVSASGDAYGIYAPDEGSSIDVTVMNTVTVTSAAGEATGVYAYGGGVILSGDHATVTADSGSGKDAYALRAQSSDIVLEQKGDVTLGATATGEGAAYGAYVPDERKLNINTNGGVSIDVTGGTGGAYGLYAESGAGSSDITATAASGAIRINATATNGGAAYGLVTSGDGASISLSAGTISVDAANGAISANGGNVTVSADTRGSLAAAGADAAVIYAANGASIDLTNIDAAAGTSGMLVIGSGDSAISAKNSVLSGDIKHSDLTLGGLNKTNVMTLSLLNDTTFTGKANSPRIDVNIDNTSTWNVTGNSSTEGVLSNVGGTVSFVNDGTDDASSYSKITVSKLQGTGGTVSFVNDGTDDTNSYSKITVSKLQGTGGKYLMHADIASGQGDQIEAETSDVSGIIGIVSPVKAGAYKARMTEDLIKITGDKNSSFTLSGDAYEYGDGAWKYALASEDIGGGSGLGWYLSNTQKVSNMGTAVLGSVIAPNIGRLEEGALYSQLGSIDYASADRSEARAWGYAIYSKFKYTDAAKAPYGGTLPGDSSAENKFYGLTGGMDKLVNAGETGSLYAGAMMGYGEGDLDITGGDASDNSFHAGIYGIYRWNSGLYAAGILKYNRYRTSVTARPEEGGAYKADYNQNGWSVSALAGKKIGLKNNWYIEPQAELGLQRIGSASYTIGGSDIAIDSTNSVRGRIGAALGRTITTDTGKILDFYVKASLLHEFDGETDISINGDPFKADFGGTWGQYKLGINYWNADNFGAHAAIVYEKGSGYESPIGFELGLNWLMGPKPQKEAAAEAETTEATPQEETKPETEAPAAKTE